MTPGRYGTNFMESEALLAACAGDHNHADRMLSQMTDTELESLRRGSQWLYMQIQLWQRGGGIDPNAL